MDGKFVRPGLIFAQNRLRPFNPSGFQRVFSHSVSIGLAGIQRARTCGGVTVASSIRLSAM
jgi:hypothetical protein